MMKKYIMFTIATMMTSTVFSGTVSASSQNDSSESNASRYEKLLRTCVQLTNAPTPSNISTAANLGCKALLQKETLRKQALENIKKNQHKFPVPKHSFTYTGDNKEDKK
jgi:hypothetical protein